MIACDTSTVLIACDGLDRGACKASRGIRYFSGIPLCPEHAPQPDGWQDFDLEGHGPFGPLPQPDDSEARS